MRFSRSKLAQVSDWSLVEALRSSAANNWWMRKFVKLSLDEQTPYFRRANDWVNEKGKPHRKKFVDTMSKVEVNDYKFCLAASFWGMDQAEARLLKESQVHLDAWGLDR